MYIRAVSNTGSMPWARASATAVAFTSGRSGETKIGAIFDGGNHTHGLVAQASNQEPFWIGRIKAVGVVQARIPPLGGSPIHTVIKLPAAHEANGQRIRFLHEA